MKKNNYVILFGLLLLVLVIVIVFSINSGKNDSQVPGSCSYVYKASNYENNIYGVANNRTGEYKLMGWPMNIHDNLDDNGLMNNYKLLAGIGCYPKPNEWVVLNITEDEYNYYSNQPTILGVVPFEEFYLCNNHNIGLVLGQDNPIDFFNNLISSGKLETSCGRLI